MNEPVYLLLPLFSLLGTPGVQNNAVNKNAMKTSYEQDEKIIEFSGYK